ncbi:GNAT family N-acetyltransferase [Sphingobium algorifonticola]|uniref:GNAT family N-acetyltransferase n=1 Tax=Sphingobium algorifonticola TaxID=2008318 RepID=A0A437J835_9SPHN|nr:GNAT family N-acetyltransferase [Sphingobium algorifonticola]
MDMAPNPALKPGMGHPLQPPDGLSPDARWATLAEAAAEPNAFYAPDMLRAAIDHLRGNADVRILEAFDGPYLIGLMPVTAMRAHGRLPVANIANWMHDQCFFGAPIVARGRERAAWTAFLAQLDQADWAPGFLHMRGLDAAGANAAALEAVCAAQRRPVREIGRYDRALLRSDLSAEAYWEANVRAKTRKEIRRLQNRLADMGRIESHILTDAATLPRWCGDFLTLEASGWKGRAGTALSCAPHTAAFFRAATAAAMAAGRLQFLRIDLDGKAIAMLVNFRHGEGAFSFKIAIDETLGRFSPGVLIEIDNLRAVLGDPGIAWMDSCAAPDHPMIDSLWGERRSIVQYRIALRGAGYAKMRRSATFAAANLVEGLAARLKER